MPERESRVESPHHAFELGSRLVLIALVIGSPWPFGSATPAASAALAAALLGLLGVFLAHRILRSAGIAPCGSRWLLLALVLVLFQQVPLPRSVNRALAPASADVYRPLETELSIAGWHPLTVEPFRTGGETLTLVSLMGAFVLAGALFRERSDRRLLGYALTVTGTALSLFAVYQKARFGTTLYGRFEVPSATPFGPFVNHNHFAGYVEACWLVTLGTALSAARRNGALAMLLGGASLVMGIALVLSHSRGGLLASVTGLAVLTWLGRSRLHREKRILVLCALATGIFLVMFAPPSVYERLSSFTHPGADASVEFRRQLWNDSIALAVRSPLLGTGLGTYAAAIPPFRTGVDETRAEFAESDWVQLLCETGLAGLLIALGLLFRTARHVLDEGVPHQGFRRGAVAAIAALAVHGLFDFNFHIPSNALLFAVLLGSLTPCSRPTWPTSRTFRLGAAAAVVAFASTVVVHTLRIGESRDVARKIDLLLTGTAEFEDLIETLQRSRSRVPQNPETVYLLGRLYNEEGYRSRDAARYRELRFAQASAAFRDAVRMGPARGRYWFELAWTEANRANHGSDELAQRLFALALELEPHWANLRANYALYLGSRGRIEEALEQLQIGRELEPGLHPLDVLNVIGPYCVDDATMLRRAAGTGEEAERALATYQRSRAHGDE